MAGFRSWTRWGRTPILRSMSKGAALRPSHITQMEDALMIKRIFIFAYGVVSYAAFLATFLYAIGFIGNFGVPKTIDGAPLLPLGEALLIDLGLLALFAVQHSVMARPAFKRWFTQCVPDSAERSTYVLASSLALIAL